MVGFSREALFSKIVLHTRTAPTGVANQAASSIFLIAKSWWWGWGVTIAMAGRKWVPPPLMTDP